MISVLLIDDDVELADMLGQYLQNEGFAAHAVHSGEEGIALSTSGGYEIVVLDVMLPTISGIEVLRRIRATSTIPVIMLTARGDNIDRVVGLDLGADDYLPKPCSPGELVARLRAILRRTSTRSGAAARVCVGELILAPANRTATWRGEALTMTGTEFNILEVLARDAGQLLGKDDISKKVFGQPLERFDRRIDVHISSIRQKLGPRADGQSWIQSVRGMGYQLLVDEP